jgi:hypothetical protein
MKKYPGVKYFLQIFCLGNWLNYPFSEMHLLVIGVKLNVLSLFSERVCCCFHLCDRNVTGCFVLASPFQRVAGNLYGAVSKSIAVGYVEDLAILNSLS